MGAEFLALVLMLVYVGAVAVLFLFVVMLLDVDFVEMKQGFWKYTPVGGFVAGILLLEMILAGAAYFENQAVSLAPPVDERSNLEAFSEVLYSEYAFYFEAAGLILLIAMIGAIVLTLRQRDDVKRQKVNQQIMRRRDQAVELVDLAPADTKTERS